MRVIATIVSFIVGLFGSAYLLDSGWSIWQTLLCLIAVFAIINIGIAIYYNIRIRIDGRRINKYYNL